jgi:outer membrane protein with beta-barrel domain
MADHCPSVRRRLALAFLLLIPASLSAQERVVIGFGGGATIPSASTADNFATGWNAGLNAQYTRARTPFGGEVGFAYHEMDLKGGAFGKQQILALTTALLVSFPTDPRTKSRLRFNLAAGVGGYFHEVELNGNKDTSYPFGVNGGAGIDLYMNKRRTAAIFLDARYHHIFASKDVDMIPITFGLKLRAK